jgi:hypothetical protein
MIGLIEPPLLLGWPERFSDDGDDAAFVQVLARTPEAVPMRVLATV